MAIHEVTYDVTFGDCDPAGIVFYPNIYRWFDRCFHDWLRTFGGHAQLCKDLGLAGIGLRSATAKFRRPVRDGDKLTILLEALDWDERTLTAHYSGTVGDTRVFTGEEQRALFVPGPAGMTAGNTSMLKAVAGQHGEAG